MPTTVDWRYHRPGWTSCGRTQEFLESHKISSAEIIPASKKLQLADGLKLVKSAARLIVCKGKKVTEFNLKKDKPSRAELAKHLLGPTGNLRAPTLVKGKTVIIGYNEEVYREVFG